MSHKIKLVNINYESGHIGYRCEGVDFVFNICIPTDKMSNIDIENAINESCSINRPDLMGQIVIGELNNELIFNPNKDPSLEPEIIADEPIKKTRIKKVK